MPDAETAATLRAVLDELCASLAPSDAGTRSQVAAKLLETVKQGRSSLADLRAAGMLALDHPPTMWP